MKQLSQFLLMTFLTVSASAQPVMSQRALLRFPTYLPFEENNMEWQRDVYREIDLKKGDNGGLGLANEPNIFSTVFMLAVDGMVPAYEYSLTGNEVFDQTTQVDMRELMKNFQIAYTEDEGKVNVNNSEIPNTEVSMYYIREKVYYDKNNSSFRTRVAAFCPVLILDDDFGDGKVKYPMFWVKYEDIEPYLMDFLVYSSNYNKAAVMTATDYFTRHLYKGEIYKVFNTQGQTLSQYCENDSVLAAERQRIEEQLMNVRTSTYKTKAQREPKAKIKEKKQEIIRPARLHLFGRRNKTNK